MMAIKLCVKGLQHISVLMQSCNDLSTIRQKGYDLPQNEFQFELYFTQNYLCEIEMLHLEFLQSFLHGIQHCQMI